MAASVTGRPDSAAAVAAGSESDVRKVSQWVSTCSKKLMNLQKLWPQGNCCTVETVGLAILYILIRKPPIFTFSVQPVNQECLVPAVRRDVSVCTGLHVTTSVESVSVHQGGEESSVTKVQRDCGVLATPGGQSLSCYFNNELVTFSNVCMHGED